MSDEHTDWEIYDGIELDMLNYDYRIVDKTQSDSPERVNSSSTQQIVNIEEEKRIEEALKRKEVALDLAGEFWWVEGIRQLKAQGLNYKSGNEACDRAWLRNMLGRVYDLFVPPQI